MKKFICVRGWKRNPTGDIIEEWEYNKLPDEVKTRNFTEYVQKSEPVKEIIHETPEVKPVSTNIRFKPFNLQEESTPKTED